MADPKLIPTLDTTFNLLDRFVSSLNSLPPDGTTPPPDSPSPLPLVSTCAATLRAQTTKLSLLIITPPFTPTAISGILSSLNDAVLPSLLTAALLLTPSTVTKAYSLETVSLTKATLRDLRDLARLVEARSKDGKPKAEPTSQLKNDVTAATGKIWDDCDELKKLADDGIAGFVVKKAEQYLDLIKDAVKEIEEWDPEEDEDEDEHGFFNDEQDTPPSLPKDPQEMSPISTPSSQPTQDLHNLRSAVLKILTRIPQSLHVVIAQRLKKGLPPSSSSSSSSSPHPINPNHLLTLDTLLSRISQTSTCIDDVAERLYTHDALGAMLTTEKARAYVVEMVESVRRGWDVKPTRASVADADGARAEEGGGGGGGREETKEDRYIERALEWIKSVGTTLPQQNADLQSRGTVT
ncbi:hypothetical protein EPUS_01918 [Endocarpon pusillum Z07020]|uniref:Cyclin-D1-binding protein 1-like N-terminal domain-containing protein n=1 Tax=Endocarpon pusillum (strain Z07020 / HMAS-L-300199) TaxID=1263415 RepID=U1GC07_ENDPU|nr:uncharacterized protein EPUS_01918 [Endocarpon pusillum Z07020]ERF69588.1 hypothetical protein EPUS_01918 [Endocarpon pusillum Z07020]